MTLRHLGMTKPWSLDVQCSAKCLSFASFIHAWSRTAAAEAGEHLLHLRNSRKLIEVIDMIISKRLWILCLQHASLSLVFLSHYQQMCFIELLASVWSLLKVSFPRVILRFCRIWFLSTLYYQTAKLLLLMQQRTSGFSLQCSQNTLLAYVFYAWLPTVEKNQ